MSHWKTFGLAIFAAVYLLGGTADSAYAQCNSLVTDCATQWGGGSVVNLGSLPGSILRTASGINDTGQVVGNSQIGGGLQATEWSGGGILSLGGLTGSIVSVASGINNAGQVVGASVFNDGVFFATEWSGGHVINLGPGEALGINASGQAVGVSGGVAVATEWSGGHRPGPGDCPQHQ